MHVTYDLNLEQSQKLVMTPKLYQAISVLQLSVLELSVYIEQQLEENPLLELGEEWGDAASEEAVYADDPIAEEGEQQEREFNWEDYFVQQYHEARDEYSSSFDRTQNHPAYSFNEANQGAVTLAEHLMSQLSLLVSSCEDKAIGEYLIGNIDHNGYLRVTLGEVREKLKVDAFKVDRMLQLIQSFDPPGVGARDLQECLLIQLRRTQIIDDVVFRLISHHLADLANGRLVRIAHQLGVSIHEVQRASDVIKALDPKPGRSFAGLSQASYILPDVVVEKIGDEYIVQVNDSTVPKVTVNSVYYSVLKENIETDPATRRFVESKLNAAVWLLRSIEQRRQTLYKVASCLVDLQKDFLENGISHLKTLNLKKVADIIGMHISTVSRVTSNKYIQTPRGIYEMKYFFSNGLDNDEGNKVSAGSIKKFLQEIVADEDSMFPLNDNRIAEILGNRGIKISRRTVAKYRDDLGIPSIQKRKRY